MNSTICRCMTYEFYCIVESYVSYKTYTCRFKISFYILKFVLLFDLNYTCP